MKIIHQDGRTQTVPDDAYARHLDTYTRAGWRVARNQDSGDDEGVAANDGIKIRSLHNVEKTVSEAWFADIYEPAGWKRVDEKAVTNGEPAQATEGGNDAQQATQPVTRARGR